MESGQYTLDCVHTANTGNLITETQKLEDKLKNPELTAEHFNAILTQLLKKIRK